MGDQAGECGGLISNLGVWRGAGGGGVTNFLLPFPRGRCRITPTPTFPMLPSHTQILHCHREGAMPKWQHTHSQSQMVLHTHTFFSFTSKCVIIYTPNTHSHAYKYGCNIQSVIWSHHTHTHTLSQGGWECGIWC